MYSIDIYCTAQYLTICEYQIPYSLIITLFFFFFFLFNDTATTEIYTLSLHDALPIYYPTGTGQVISNMADGTWDLIPTATDRKSTRLNSSHANISYAVFCLKKKK